MLDGIKKVGINLKDPKKKAITKLVLYLIFFVIVFVVIFSNEDKRNYEYTPSEPITNNTLSYNYIINIDENNNLLNINGVYSEELESFNYNNITYTTKDNLIYLNGVVVDNPIKYNIKDYYYDTIKELINNKEYMEQTTYSDKSIKTIYNIKVNEYLNECTLNCENDIVVTVYEKDYIYNVVMDLSSLYNYKYIIDIKYEKTSD